MKKYVRILHDCQKVNTFGDLSESFQAMSCWMNVVLAGMKTIWILYISIRTPGWSGPLSISSDILKGNFFFFEK